MSPEQARRVAALNLDGIGFIKESRRFYPNKELAAHLLGYVGLDNKGLGGLESTYDSQIRGKAGTMLVQTDARRHAFARVERPPTAGVDHRADRSTSTCSTSPSASCTAASIENPRAGGSAIIMNPHTGEILAMANEPTFNPNAYREFDDDRSGATAPSRICTSRARRSRSSPRRPRSKKSVLAVDTPIDTNPGRFDDRRRASSPTTGAATTAC